MALLNQRWMVIAAIGISLVPATECRAQTFQEYEVKAAFLYNFTQFVAWPESAFADQGAPFVIGVLGVDPFGRILDELVAGELVGDHPLTVRRFAAATEIETCHVLFVSRSETARLAGILSVLAGRPILIAGDAAGFANRGGTVGLETVNNRIQLHLNLITARAAELTISSKLLRIAKLVDAGGAPP